MVKLVFTTRSLTSAVIVKYIGCGRLLDLSFGTK